MNEVKARFPHLTPIERTRELSLMWRQPGAQAPYNQRYQANLKEYEGKKALYLQQNPGWKGEKEGQAKRKK